MVCRMMARRAILPTILASSLLLGACTPPGVPSDHSNKILKKVRTRPLIVAFEGLQPFSGSRIHDVVRAIGDELDMAHAVTSGNPAAHYKFVREAGKHGQPIFIVGYSMGGSSAVSLARWCGEEKIPVRLLFLLDPAVVPGKIPGNVDGVVVIESDSVHMSAGIDGQSIEDSTRTRLDVLSVPCGHVFLPYECSVIIRSRINSHLSGG